MSSVSARLSERYSNLVTRNDMSGVSPYHTLSIDEIILGAIEREEQMKAYYKQALEEVGPDARDLLLDLSIQHDERINRLRHMLSEIEELRELNAAIAD
ncbi:MAG: hypothetical protein EPO24_05920 [Bacteroidetes bacterium]|nr:MAG: hypothetical protein EPO24_05920 [Bacteroidota bacterium]